MIRRIVLLAGAVATAIAVLPAPSANAGGSTVVIGGGPEFPFSLCAEFGTAPNHWILVTQLTNTVFAQYGSGTADKTKFNTAKQTGEVIDKTGIGAENTAHAITAKLEVTYKAGGQGTVVFSESAPIKVKYVLKGPAVVDLTSNCSATFNG